MKVKFAPTGRLQFLSAVAYIRQDNPLAARRFRERAEKALRTLVRFPLSGTGIPEFPGLPNKEVIVSPYRFFYRVEAKTVWVVGVRHSARLPSEPRR